MNLKPTWKISSYCSAGTCFGVQLLEDRIVAANTGDLRAQENLNESKTCSLDFSLEEWRTFTEAVLTDSPSTEGYQVREQGDAWIVASEDLEVSFTAEEWEAFRLGVANGEFSLESITGVSQQH